MSARLDRSQLTRDDEQWLAQILTIKPESKSKSNKYRNEESPFPFYCASNKDLYIPYAFATKYLDSFPHDTIEYPNVKYTSRIQLRERQLKKANKLNSLFESQRTAILCAHTGFGKTILANYYINKHSLRTAILVPGTVLLNQWYQAVQACLGCKVWSVGDEEILDAEVIICMPERWKYIPPDTRAKIGFLIVDEAHMFCTPSRCISLLQFEPKYILALTASPRRSNGTLDIIHALCGYTKIYAKYLNQVCVWRFDTGISIETLRNYRHAINWSGTIKKLTETDKRNELIADLTWYLVSVLKRKPLLMCERKKHITDLVTRIKARDIACDYIMEKKSTYTDSQALIALAAKAGTGFDEQYACPEFNGVRLDCIIYCMSIKDTNQLIQYGGRIFRSSDPLIIHLVDNNGILHNHWRLSRQYYLSGEYLKSVEILKVSAADLWI